MPPIRGRPPTASQELLIKAADSLGPDKSLANLDAAAKLILANVVLVASVFTGFGLFTDVTTRLREQPELFALAVDCAILSAVLAILALLPLPGRVDVDNLQSIRARFGRLSVIRGTLVAFATIFLLAALGSASRAHWRTRRRADRVSPRSRSAAATSWASPGRRSPPRSRRCGHPRELGLAHPEVAMR